MREALAAADHDYILAESVSKPKRIRNKNSAAKRRVSGRRKIQARRYIGVIASALCVAAIAGIVINALTLQKMRHPAPLFARVARHPAAKEPAIVESLRPATPIPAPRPQPDAPAISPPREKVTERAQAAAPTLEKPANEHAHPASAAQAAHVVEARPDPISQLLREDAHAPQSGPQAHPDNSVLEAQRALVKLGFVLRSDGVMGAATRQAIERYERDHKRSVRGDLTPTLMRQLSAESGIPIN